MDRVFTATEEPDQIATLVYLLVNPVARRAAVGAAVTCRSCCAGPVGEPELVDAGSGSTPLGWPEPRVQRTLELGPGDLLLGLTDGLVERRGRDLDEGLADVLTAVGTAEEPLAALVERVAADLLPDTPGRDDSTVLAVRFATDRPVGGPPRRARICAWQGPRVTMLRCVATTARSERRSPQTAIPSTWSMRGLLRARARREVVRVGHGSPAPAGVLRSCSPGSARAGKDRGYVTASDVRTVFEDAGIPPSRMKAVLRSLSDEGVSVMVEADGSAATRKAVAAATAAKRATTTKAVAAPRRPPPRSRR